MISYEYELWDEYWVWSSGGGKRHVRLAKGRC